MTYEQAIAYVASLAPRGWRLGLDRMEELVQRAGVSDAIGGEAGPRFIHMAGTNGKGSVTAYLQSMMVESGYQTGAFFSPYVYDIRERVQLGRHMISKADLVRLTEVLKPIEESFADTDFGGVTEFEFKTALGFKYWKEHSCDWVALEVGLGGRLDATNVVTPRASVVVSIGLDHTSILGNTHAEIAYEKAGVVKHGIPVVVGQLLPEAMEVVEREAEIHEAPIWRYGREVQVELEISGRHFKIHTPARTHDNLRPGLVGKMQIHNMALAVAAFDASGAYRDEKAVHKGTRTASLPGRFERRVYHGCDVVLDGAHNVEAATVLADTLEQEFPTRRVVLVTGMVAGHEPARFYKPLAHLVDVAHVSPIAFHRALPPDEVATALMGEPFEVRSHVSASEALTAAHEDAGEGGLIVVTGSFYLVGEIARLLH
jgi:dihydrofolate synthase / folylpolyglutamate synthase